MNFKTRLLSYVCIESFYIYFLYTWTSTYTLFCLKGASWGHYVIGYACLISSLFLGSVFGRVIYKTRHTFRVGVTKNNLNGAFFLAALSFLLLAIITRYSLLICVYFIIGFVAARIGATQDVEPKEFSKTYSTNNTASELETELHAKRKITIFIFSSLCSSLLYNVTSDASVSFPAYNCSLFFSMVVTGIFVLNVLSDRTMLHRIYSLLPCRKTPTFKSRRIGKLHIYLLNSSLKMWPLYQDIHINDGAYQAPTGY